MSSSKLTKAELITRSKKLEKRVAKLKASVDGYVFKKNKHGNRLDQLGETTRDLSKQFNHVVKQLTALSSEEKGVSDWRTGVGTRLDELSASFKDVRKRLERLSSHSDDLQREGIDLTHHVRGLEENSSEVSVRLSSQESRLLDLEGGLAEITRQQQTAEQDEVARGQERGQQLKAAIDPLRAQLSDLQLKLAEDYGQHKEMEPRLQELINRIGDMEEQFSHVSDEIAVQRQVGSQLSSNLDARLQALDSKSRQLEQLEIAASREEERSGELEEQIHKLTAELGEIQGDRVLQHKLEEQLQKLNIELKEIRGDSNLQHKLEERLQKLDIELKEIPRDDNQQHLLEKNISSLTNSVRQLSAQVDALATEVPSLPEKLAGNDDSSEKLQQKLRDLESQEQDSSGKIAKLSQLLAKSLERLKVSEPVIVEQSRGILALQGRFDEVEKGHAKRQDLVDKIQAGSKRNAIAIGILLLIGLASGLWLYQQITHRLTDTRQQLVQKIDEQGEDYVSRTDHDARYRSLESTLATTDRKIDELSASAGRSMQNSIERIDRELKQLTTAFAGQQTIEPNESTSAESKQRLERIETVLSQLQDQAEKLSDRTTTEQHQNRDQQQRLSEEMRILTGVVDELKSNLREQTRPEPSVRWGKAGAAGRYTLQLAGTHDQEALLRFSQRHPLPGDRSYYRTLYEGRDWYTLFQGIYDTQQQATEALDALPASAKRYRPWVRRIPSEGIFADLKSQP